MIEFFAMLESALCEMDIGGNVFVMAGSRSSNECRPAARNSVSSLAQQLPLSLRSNRELSIPPARGRVVLIEGLDLAGKSTLVRNLAIEMTRRGISVRVSRNALCPDNPVAFAADRLRRDPDAGQVETGSLFLASHLWDARHFTPPPPGTVHIQDSCWLRTMAYHTVHRTPYIPQILRMAIPSFPYFDAAVYLTADITERQRRLTQRQLEQPGSNDDGDRVVVRDPKLFQELDRSLGDLAEQLAGATRLDTTYQAGHALVARVIKVMGLDRSES